MEDKNKRGKGMKIGLGAVALAAVLGIGILVGRQSVSNTEQEGDLSPEEKVAGEQDPGTMQNSPCLNYEITGNWENGDLQMYGLNFGLENGGTEAISGWTLVLQIPGVSEVTGWNGNFTIKGDTLTITNAEYNGEIPAGAVVYPGCNLGVKGSLTIQEAKLNGKTLAVKEAHVDPNAPAQSPQTQSSQTRGETGADAAAVSAGISSVIPSLQGGPGTAGAKAAQNRAISGDDWLHTDGRHIYDAKGQEVWLTGASWFGFNTGTNTFDGLWNSELSSTVAAIADHGLNLIRVPISAQLINQWAAGEYPKANYNNAYNPDLNSMNSLEIFDHFLALAEENGLKVMMDIHSAETDASGHNVNLWYTQKVSVEDYYKALGWMARRYKDNDTIIAYDLKNEPHGKPNEGSNAAIWNDSQAANNWKYVAETAAARVLAENPNVLIVVEGTEIYPKNIQTNGDYHSTDSGDYYFNWWGGNLRGVADHPIDLGAHQDKLVYSPHDYGPTVYQQPWFQGGYTYESLMKDCWHDNWFFIYEQDIAPLLIGEWGGFMREPNLSWMTYMRRLIGTYHLNHTFWCINANSGDTGGLLKDDFVTWDEEKYNFLKEVLWQKNGKFVGLDHAVPLGKNGISLSEY